MPKSVVRKPSARSTSTVTPQIIGGSQTTIGAAPYMLQLWYSNAASGEATFCAGTLVAPNKVMTAAHCVYGMDWYNNGVVLGGTATLLDDNAKVALVKRQWVNPGYNPSSIDNDVAVLTLDRTLPLATAKIAANTDSALYAAGTNATVYGWGLTSSGPDGNLSDVLKQATLPIEADATCDAALSASLGQDLFVNGHMVCAGPASTGDDTTTTTTCVGDSGGPLVVNGRVAGIVSWGVSEVASDGGVLKYCGSSGTYPVFTKVSAYTGVTLARVNDADWSGDGRADVFARYKTGGTARVYKGVTLTTSSSAGSGWGSFNKVLQTDLNRDGVVDYIVRTTSGALYWRHKYGSTMYNTKLSSYWSTVKQIIAPGDVTGDALPDLLSVNSSGYLYVYPGKGNGTFGSAKKLGTGWLSYAQVVGHGDYTGDGRPDLIARTSGGAAYLFPSSTTGTFGTRKLLSSSALKSATGIAATGDVNGDGKSDLVTRSSTGTLWLYKGSGYGTFASPVKAATGVNSFNLFG
ncbi:trypsin-like serine protease [Actinomadura scrupuli]|uniref:trypsin-like serine protease n=1 Tax=Actinomadura scrupuli TaxID=559629 RepID=UPI003D9851F7